MKKKVIIINGIGASGKDTLCGFVKETRKISNISSIAPIKAIALSSGWDGTKTEKNRKFLSDLKQLYIKFNDLPTKYLIEELNKFKNTDKEFLFVHIREPEEIEKFKKVISFPYITLMIKRNQQIEKWNNCSDDGVDNYIYDYTYLNNKTLSETKTYFPQLLDSYFEDKYKFTEKTTEDLEIL